MAATQENRPILGMQDLLEELADSSDEFVSRICSWHLANHYRMLHPTGQLRGYVQRAERDDVDIYLVFDPKEYADRPYAATVYPRESCLSDDVAWKWIEKLLPPEIRPRMEDNEWPYQSPDIKPHRAMYVYGAYFVDLFGDSGNKRWDRVWIKWPRSSSCW